jgi:hypothetical protein
MKLNKTITALALAMGLASVSQADNAIYITGSTAFRAQIYQALTDLGVVQKQAPNSNTRYYSGTVKALNDDPGYGANLSAGSVVDAYCSFSGSGGGIYSLVNSSSPTYVDVNGNNTTCAWGADVTFSDVDQTTVPYNLVPKHKALGEISSVDGGNSSYGSGCAVVCWCWAASVDCANLAINTTGPITDLTPGEMSDLLKNGWEFQSIMTGNTTAPNNAGAKPALNGDVYLTGRSYDSGTRITAELLTGWDPATAIGTVYTINGGDGTPPGSGTFQVDNLTTQGPAGYDGYTSGGNVVLALNEAGAGMAVSYVAFTDAEAYGANPYPGTPAACLTGGAIPLNFWGVSPLTVPVTSFVANDAVNGKWNFAAIESGQYPFWSYEHCYFSAHDKAAGNWVQFTFMPDLIAELQYEIVNPALIPGGGGTKFQQAADLIKNLQVHRQGDGGPILQGN